jgi:hypothetical protein
MAARGYTSMLAKGHSTEICLDDSLSAAMSASAKARIDK